MSSSPIIVAHRGLHHVAPENSLAAFAAAVEAKIPWVECDVWESSDGMPVVIHDQTLDRTTTGTGEVSQHTWQQLQQLKVPCFSDLLQVVGNTTGILVEIKPPNAVELVGKILRELRPHSGPWMIQSFHKENVAHALDLNSSIPTAYLAEEPHTIQQAIELPWPSIHLEYPMIDQALVDRLHRAGRKIGAWTVNAPTEIERMVNLGIDMLITDEPELAAQLVAKRSPAASAAVAIANEGAPPSDQTP